MKKQHCTFANTVITDIQQIPPEMRTSENLRPIKTISATCLCAEPEPKGSVQYQKVGVVTNLGYIPMPLWIHLADEQISKHYGNYSLEAKQIGSVAMKSLLFGTDPEFYAHSTLIEQSCIQEPHAENKRLLLQILRNPVLARQIFRELGTGPGPLIPLEEKERTDIVMHFTEVVYQTKGQMLCYAAVFDSADAMEQYFSWLLVSTYEQLDALADRRIAAFALSGERTNAIDRVVDILRKECDISLVFLEESSETDPPTIREIGRLLHGEPVDRSSKFGRTLSNLK